MLDATEISHPPFADTPPALWAQWQESSRAAFDSDIPDWQPDPTRPPSLDAKLKAPVALKAEKKKPWRDHVMKASFLQTATFAPISYVLAGLIPEGLTIIAGRPKVGKSWAALEVCVAVASNTLCFGDRQPIHGDVLYCALEDNPRRLQSRIKRILAGRDMKWPDRLTLATAWQRLDAGGVDDAREWAASVPKPVLIIFDTLAGIRPDRNNKDTLYEGDYRALQQLHAWANEQGISIIVLHHTRKMESEDPLDTVSGSLGLTGCADTTLILAKTSQGATLYLRGRDVEEAEHAVAFDPMTCRWSILGNAADVHRSDSRQAILGVLIEATDLMTPAEIASGTGLLRNNIDQLLHLMVANGDVLKPSRGNYIHRDRQDLLPPKKPKNLRNGGGE